MSLEVFQAVVDGYSDRLVDSQIIAVQSGYWTAYYLTSKHSKPVSTIAEELKSRQQKQSAGTVKKPRPDVDVEAFLQQERLFNAELAKGR